MIHVENIRKTFGSQVVLDDLSLDIPQGKITVIIGRSGEGKSVLLKHLMGLMLPDAGQIVVDGANIGQMDVHQVNEMRKKFGMVFQHAALFDSLNVYENVAFPLREHTAKTENQIKQRVQEVLELVGLKDADNKMPSDLSGGMRKRVGLARAISNMPKILLYDEPTTGLDPIMTDVIDQLILATQKELGVTSVVISHDIKATFEIADKVAMLYRGKVLLEGDENQFRQSKHPFIQGFLHGKAIADDLQNI